MPIPETKIINFDDVSESHNFLSAMLGEAVRQLGGTMKASLGVLNGTGGMMLEIDEETGDVTLTVSDEETTLAMRELKHQGRSA